MPRPQPRTVVVTGASAGIGRAVALAFARRGWQIGLIARSKHGLDGARKEIELAGGQAMAISADVADADAIFTAADQINERWGGIDVWVNNAMATIFSPFAEISPAEYRRATEVTYLGYVFGTMAALRCMRPRNRGTIVQVGSALSYRAIPLQSAYCGAKFAIRGFTEALRSELRHQRSGIRITMVQLPAVNTPQFDWARNKLPFRLQPVPPIHQPEAVAEAILRASQKAPRELWVGFTTIQAILGNMVLPGLLDRWLARRGYDGQLTSEPELSVRAGNLFAPVADMHAAHGRFDDRARGRVSALNPAVLRSAIPAAALIIIAAAIIFTRSLVE
ncbi:MAG TPA: SDR family oxidoreductase [Xanthobacteraceae bacterium]